MATESKISWTETTWSPVIGCTKLSAGCKHCYAEREVDTRWSKNPKSIWYGRRFADVLCRPDTLAGAKSPLTWKKPRRIFVCPRADLFHHDVPVEFIAQVFDVMARCPQHTFQVLTKRAKRMQFVLWSELDWTPLPNVHLGVSIEDQPTADERIMELLRTPAAVRWVSAEPMIKPVDISPFLEWRNTTEDGAITNIRSLSWVVAGGESGPHARPSHPDWFRVLHDQCEAAGVPFNFKQWGEWYPARLLPADTQLRRSEWAVVDRLTGEFRTAVDGQAVVDPERHELMGRIGVRKAGRLLDGVLHDEFPEVRHA